MRLRRLAFEVRVRSLDLLHRPEIVPWRAIAARIASTVLRPFRLQSSLSFLCGSHRILLLAGDDARFCRWLEGRVAAALKRACRRGGLVEPAVRGGAAAAVDTDLAEARIAGLVLKPPRHGGAGVVERGVLLLKNTERIDSFRRCVDLERLLGDYTLVLEPSWSGYADPRLLAFTIHREHRVVVMSPCQADHDLLRRLEANLLPIAIGAGDWVNPEVFHPLEGQTKRFDAVVVARWTLLKRHHLLLRAMRQIGDPSYRVALVAMNLERDTDREAILAMIADSGLGDQITVFEDLDHAGVNAILNQAKVNVLLSRQEGANRSLFEGFFAGVPGLAFVNHVGIDKTHFTPQTGRLIAEDELAGALLWFRAHHAELDPRPWALAHIAPRVTTARLNGALVDLAKQRGEPWTRDIVTKCNAPEAQYYPEGAGEGLASMPDILRRFAVSEPQRSNR